MPKGVFMSYESFICTQLNSDDDVFLWPDSVWCYRTELNDFSHKSDDYEILYALSVRWFQITFS